MLSCLSKKNVLKKIPVDPASLSRRKIPSTKVNMRVNFKTLLNQFFFLMKYMYESKNSSKAKDLNTQSNFSGIYGKNKHVTTTISISSSVSIS